MKTALRAVLKELIAVGFAPGRAGTWGWGSAEYSRSL